MFPVLFSIGTITVYTFSIFLILAWVVFSFSFWRHLKDQGIAEDYIFDMMFYGTIAAFVGGRVGFVMMYPELFVSWKWIRAFTIWIQPGFILYGALIPALCVFLYAGYRHRIKISIILDAFAKGVGSSLFFGFLGAMFGGSVVGTLTNFPLAVTFVGQAGKRHPVGLYEVLGLIGIMGIFFLVQKIFKKSFGANGMYALWFFLLFSIGEFCLEFLKESRVYWGGLHLNQWILIMVFAECVGVLLVWGGGKEGIGRGYRWVVQSSKKIGGVIYAKFSKRNS